MYYRLLVWKGKEGTSHNIELYFLIFMEMPDEAGTPWGFKMCDTFMCKFM